MPNGTPHNMNTWCTQKALFRTSLGQLPLFSTLFWGKNRKKGFVKPLLFEYMVSAKGLEPMTPSTSRKYSPN